jgi:hypothetical protein
MPKNLIKSRLVWLTLALLALVPFLAYLQWKWVGEAVDREEEQLSGTLQTAAVQFLYSFNQRIIQVQQSFFTPFYPDHRTNTEVSLECSARILAGTPLQP